MSSPLKDAKTFVHSSARAPASPIVSEAGTKTGGESSVPVDGSSSGNNDPSTLTVPITVGSVQVKPVIGKQFVSEDSVALGGAKGKVVLFFVSFDRGTSSVCGKVIGKGSSRSSGRFCGRQDCSIESHKSASVAPAIQDCLDNGVTKAIFVRSGSGNQNIFLFEEPLLDVTTWTEEQIQATLEESHSALEWAAVCSAGLNTGAPQQQVMDDALLSTTPLKAPPTPSDTYESIEEQDLQLPDLDLTDDGTPEGTKSLMFSNLALLHAAIHQNQRDILDLHHKLYPYFTFAHHAGVKMQSVSHLLGAQPLPSSPTITQSIVDLHSLATVASSAAKSALSTAQKAEADVKRLSADTLSRSTVSQSDLVSVEDRLKTFVTNRPFVSKNDHDVLLRRLNNLENDNAFDESSFLRCFHAQPEIQLLQPDSEFEDMYIKTRDFFKHTHPSWSSIIQTMVDNNSARRAFGQVVVPAVETSQAALARTDEVEDLRNRLSHLEEELSTVQDHFKLASSPPAGDGSSANAAAVPVAVGGVLFRSVKDVVAFLRSEKAAPHISLFVDTFSLIVISHTTTATAWEEVNQAHKEQQVGIIHSSDLGFYHSFKLIAPTVFTGTHAWATANPNRTKIASYEDFMGSESGNNGFSDLVAGEVTKTEAGLTRLIERSSMSELGKRVALKLLAEAQSMFTGFMAAVDKIHRKYGVESSLSPKRRWDLVQAIMRIVFLLLSNVRTHPSKVLLVNMHKPDDAAEFLWAVLQATHIQRQFKTYHFNIPRGVFLI